MKYDDVDGVLKMGQLFNEGLALGSFFALNIFLVVISTIIEYKYNNKKASDLKRKVVVVHTILFICLLGSLAILINIGWTKAIIAMVILVLGTLLSTKLASYFAGCLQRDTVNCDRSSLDRRRIIYENSAGYFIYAVTLVAIGLMAKSSIWLLGASISFTAGFANAFFELAMKDGIDQLDPDQVIGENTLWSEYFTDHELPIAFMLGSILILYPIYFGFFNLNKINQIYGYLINASIAMIGIVVGASLANIGRLKTGTERKTLSKLICAFVFLCIILMFVSIFGGIHARDPFDLQNCLQIINVPLAQRDALLCEKVTDMALLGVAFSLSIGIALYMISLISLSFRMCSKKSDSVP
jgi:hypothetical protein